MPTWSDKLAHPVQDKADNVTLRTRDDARHYMAALPTQRAMRAQWQAAAQLPLEGADAEAVTRANSPTRTRCSIATTRSRAATSPAVAAKTVAST